jgi:hypothetical protein
MTRIRDSLIAILAHAVALMIAFGSYRDDGSIDFAGCFKPRPGDVARALVYEDQ